MIAFNIITLSHPPQKVAESVVTGSYNRTLVIDKA